MALNLSARCLAAAVDICCILCVHEIGYRVEARVRMRNGQEMERARERKKKGRKFSGNKLNLINDSTLYSFFFYHVGFSSSLFFLLLAPEWSSDTGNFYGSILCGRKERENWRGLRTQPIIIINLNFQQYVS